MTEQGVLVVSEFEWLSLEHALLTGSPHPLDDLLEGRRVVVATSEPVDE